MSNACAICAGRKKPGAWALNPDYGGDTYVAQFVWCCRTCYDAATETVDERVPSGLAPREQERAVQRLFEARDKTLTEMIRLARIRRAEDFVKAGGV